MAVNPSDRQSRLEATCERMQQVDPEHEYYQFTLTASDDGNFVWAAYTHFVGFTETTPRFELRAASLINAERFVANLGLLGENCLVVNDLPSLSIFFALGGYVLVERSIAETYLADLLEPEPSAPSGPLGFRGLKNVPQAELQRAPTKRQRSRILKRDGYRCRLCGERPADNVLVTLHVHHIRMWSRGGLTEDINLITICHACHGGLSPHEDSGLFDLVPGGAFADHLSARRSQFTVGVTRYRGEVKRLLAKPASESAEESVSD